MQVGPYVVTGEIARGANGVVYQARDAEREVALKVLSSPSANARKRFAREVEALTRLPRHPGIVQMLAAGEHEGRPWLAMDLVRGPSLQERLDRGDPLAPWVAVKLGLKLARALAHAHEHGVLHRDLKPANIVLSGGTEPLLVDLGLVKDLSLEHSRLTQTGQFLGTPGYWPPEQALGRATEATPAADVYALGATLFAAVTGRPPFVSDTLPEAIAAAGRAPPRPSSLARDVDPAFEAVILRCLEKEPERRFASAGDVAAALERCIAPRRRRRSRTRVALAAAGALALVLIIAIIAIVPAGPAPPPPVASPTTTVVAPSCPSPSPPQGPDPAARAQEHLVRAWTLMTEVRNLEAIAECDAALALVPDSSRALSLRGYARMRSRDHEGGRADCERALALAPDDPLALTTRGLIATFANDLAAARADYDRALANDSTLASAWFHRGSLRQATNDPHGALADLDQALAREPGSSEAWAYRALVKGELGDFAGSLADADEALRLWPESMMAHVHRGMALAARGDLVGAEQAHRSALALAATKGDLEGEARFQLANVLALAKRDAEALVEYDRVLGADARNVDALVKRSFVRERTGDLRGSEEDLVAAVAVMPDPRLFESLGALRLRRDDPEGAVAALDQALAVAPEHDEARVQRAALRMRLKVSGAREDLDHVLSRDARHVSALMLRADLSVGEGDRTAAEADLRQVLALSRPDSEVADLARKALDALTAPR